MSRVKIHIESDLLTANGNHWEVLRKLQGNLKQINSIVETVKAVKKLYKDDMIDHRSYQIIKDRSGVSLDALYRVRNTQINNCRRLSIIANDYDQELKRLKVKTGYASRKDEAMRLLSTLPEDQIKLLKEFRNII